ncbi:ABC transporter permease [Ruminococcus sp.]|uniref:ABC transporter permease n=1 Tax=Ruminococcus sp. TaxID=41978 RepID=UPI0025CF59BC|nr:ABC transporter permease [Ruminococcus sp.]MCR4638651.1 ABC transporter permease [Ruminococcus sp.]
MANLLAEGYRRLFKGKRFYIVMAVMAAIPVLFTLLYAASNSFMEAASREDGEAAEMLAGFKSYADDLLFSHTGVMVLLVGIAAGMLIVQDFRNNTIRNKIIVGHSRTKIYLANLIVSLTVMMIYELVYIFIALAFGGLMLGFRDFPNKAIIVNMLLVLPIEIAMTSLIVFLCNSMKNVGGFVLSISMHYIVSMFSLALLLLHKHPKIMEIVKEAVPSYQMDLLGTEAIPEHWLRMMLFMFGITIISTLGGILIFNKSDLK